MTFSRSLRSSFLFLSLLLSANQALALDLNQARMQGSIGEQADGYTVALQPTAEAQALAQSINARRREEYKRIAQEKSQPVDVVAKLAAKTIIEKLPAGSMYQTEGGQWQKR